MKVFLILLAFCIPAYGRLGESKEECAKRYGKPVKEDGPIALYSKNNFVIVITFVDGKAASLMYGHSDEKLRISKLERDALIKANAANRRIVEIKDKNFLLPENADALLYTYLQGKLVITDQKGSRKIRDMGKAEEIEDLKGL